MPSKIKEIIDQFLFKKDPSATYPREEILAKFVHTLNTQRNIHSHRAPYSSTFVSIIMEKGGVRNTAIMCWFYEYCEESGDFSGTWHNLLRNVDNPVEKPVEELGNHVEKVVHKTKGLKSIPKLSKENNIISTPIVCNDI